VAQHAGEDRFQGVTEEGLVSRLSDRLPYQIRHRDSKFPDYIWAFHDKEEIGPRMLARIAKHTGLTPADL
jgi:hypothetical protein